MSDDLSTKGVVELEFIAKDLNKVITDLGRFNEETGYTVKAATAAERAANRAATSLGAIGTAASKSATAQASATKANKEGTTSLIAQRYALYDVATTYGVISATLLAASGYAVKLGADFESAFTNVQRTSNASAASLASFRGELVDLSTQIPLTFADLSKIATLGNQLGIPEQDISSFTQTVAKFATVTGLSVDAAATAFGSLGELLNLAPQDYEKLGSAIAYVGRNSVATEAEIVALTTRLAASATKAGFTTQEVVALSGALASLRVAPERAQGVLEVYFNRLNSALAEGGDKLQSFANVAGLTVDQVRELAATDPNKFFREFAAGLSRLDSVSQTQALEALGLSGIRAGEVFGRVAGNINVFDKALSDANSSYAAGTELQSQYAKVLDDLNSQFMIFVNAINALIESMSGGLVPGLAGVLAQLTEVVNKVREFTSSPLGQFISGVIIGLTTLFGVLFAYRSAVALATASTYALTTAQAGLAATGTAAGIRGLITALLGISGAAGTATTRVGLLKAGLAGVGKATLILALVDAVYQLTLNFTESTHAADNFFQSIGIRLPKVTALLEDAQGGAFGLQNGMLRIGNAAVSAGQLAIGALSPLVFLMNLLSGGFDLKKNKSSRGDHALAAATTDANAYADSLGAVGGAAGGASAEVRTLVDYANDLSTVFKRAFDIRFGGQQGLDTITAGWSSIAQATADANQQIAEYRATMQSLTADRAIKEYWLSVAENYGDALRAGELRAELADLDNQLAKNSADLTTAQDKNSKSLVGNTDGAIANRATVLALVGDYQSYLVALASSGAGQDELRSKAASLKADFLAQATQLGYNNVELQQYAAAFDDVTFAINNVPRNITVDADMNPAIQALNEYLAQVNSSSASPSIGGGGYAAGAADGAAYADAFQSAAQSIARNRSSRTSSPFDFNIGGAPIGSWGSFPFAEGGYTGDGGKYEPKGVVHGGEFVFSKAAVNNIGVGNLAYAHNMAKRGKGYAEGGPVGRASSMLSGGMSIVQLSPTDRQLLMDMRSAIDRGLVIPVAAVGAAAGVSATNQSNRRTA